MEFITTGNRIAVENFSIGKVYTIVWATGNYKSLACVGKGSDFVMFQDQAPDLLFCLTMDTAITVESIEEGGGGAGTMNYNELENKPSINGIVLVGNKTGADLNLVSQSDLDDYATNASVVAGLATKQDALSSSQLAAVNSGITSALVTQIGTNTSAIAGKQDALSSSQLAAVNSGITSALVTQIGTNTSAIAGKQDALSSSQLAAVNSGITSTDVAQITTNKNNISTAQNELALFNHATGSSIFFSETQPIAEMISGSYWISTDGIKIATRSTNQLFSGMLLSGLWSSVDTISDRGHFAYRSFKTYLSAGTYTISFASAVNIVRQIADNTLTENIGTNLTEYTLTTTTDNYIGFSFRLTGSTMSPWDNSNIMLNAGSTAMSYEPYVTWT